MLSPFLFLSLILLSLIPATLSTDCRIHPAYSESFKPVLVSRWQFSNRNPTPEQSVYLRRYTKHLYVPYNNKNSKRYHALDLFYPISGPHRRISMSFQRSATVYVFAFVKDSDFNPRKRLFLPGWKSLGWAVLSKGDTAITYGIHQKLTQRMPTYTYVFSKVSKKRVDLPNTSLVRKATREPAYFVLIAEANGKPSPAVGKFKGRSIASNARCPDFLHDAWVTRDPNTDDRDTRGKLFRTWHPAWDPCFWCAYDHDHGANPGVLNYKPMYDYTAYKNNRQDEPHPGFKGFIFSFGKYWMYLNLHLQSSKIRRIFTRTHTMNIVVAEKKTNKIFMDLRFKADFGFAAVQTKRRQLFPLTNGNRRIQESQKLLMFRTINILNLAKLDRRFLLKDRNIRRGVYEEWQTIPICSKPVSPLRGLQFTLKSPGTGILSIDKTHIPVPLGRTLRKKLYRSLNLYRTVKFRRLFIGGKYCPGGRSGVFYTDPDGKKVLKGPGRTAVRQYVKPGFELFIEGKHEATDPWDGIYSRNKKGFFRDHGYGLDPTVV